MEFNVLFFTLTVLTSWICVEGDSLNVGRTIENVECNCVGGKCIEDKGELKCSCPQEFGLISKNACKECGCGKDANCTFGEDSNDKKCICPQGLKEKNGKCELGETNACLSSPCQNGGTCQVTGDTFKCTCPGTYSGRTCEETTSTQLSTMTTKSSMSTTLPPAVCDTNPCQNGGTCQPTKESVKCICVGSYSGKNCEISPCDGNPCKNGGECTVDEGYLRCFCIPPYYGLECEHEYTTPESTVVTEAGSPSTGSTANITTPVSTLVTESSSPSTKNSDPCNPNPCKHGGTCTPNGNSFNCTCLENHGGDTCEKVECECENGNCVVDEETLKIRCDCLPEYGSYTTYSCKPCNCGRGANCTFNKIGDTDHKTCICPYGKTLKNGVCVASCDNNVCKHNATCVANGDVVLCVCKPPYSGDWCEKSPCDANLCKNGGTCKVDMSKFVCLCPPPYKGLECQRIECEENICQNGGKCEMENNMTFCECPHPYEGKYCERTPCDDNLCLHGGTCVIENDEAVCKCIEPYHGAICQEDICDSNPCANDGTCKVVNDTVFECICKEPFSGPHCDRSPCDENPCQNNGICNIVNKQITCDCEKPYSGDRCEKNPCTVNPCQNRGACVIAKDSYKCMCKRPYTGNNCERSPCTKNPCQNGGTCKVVKTSYACSCVEPYFGNDCEFPNTTTPSVTGSTEGISSSTESTDNPSVSTISSTTTETVITSTKHPDCQKNICENGGTCKMVDNTPRCFCVYPYGGATCTDSHWCTEGLGKELCSGKCSFNFKTLIGQCDCAEKQFYNYEKMVCEAIDLCPLLNIKCTAELETCVNGACDCQKNYKRNDQKKCIPNFCESAPSPCKDNENCEDDLANPGSVKCSCKSGFYFDGITCKKGNACTLPTTLSCQQICNATSESCECYKGFDLEPDKKTCKINKTDDLCKSECGAGVCVNRSGNETCSCPSTHKLVNSTCVDLCAAGALPTGLCPDDQCISDQNAKFGYRCKCDGKYTYDETEFSCRRKSICTEEGGSKDCKSKQANCKEDSGSKDGYRCECEEGKDFDSDGVCKDRCSIEKNIQLCAERSATCDPFETGEMCKCPPAMVFGKDNRCTELAKSSYTTTLTLYKGRYINSKLYHSVMTAFLSESVDITDIRKDLKDSMHLLFGKNYKYADVLTCKNDDASLTCVVEVQFNNDPKDQVRVIGDESSCISTDADKCFIPPRLMLDKKQLKTDVLSKTDPCMKEIKDKICGTETECSRPDNTDPNFVCTCANGFYSTGSYQPVSDPRTVIHRCKDIDECLLPKSCPNRTRCLNTYGSYECLCLSGYKPPTEGADVKVIGCVSVCQPSTCNHGKCEVAGSQYQCNCEAGYNGVNCDKQIAATADAKGMQVALIILATIIVPTVLLAIFMFQKYRILKKKTADPYFDDDTSTINMIPISENVTEEIHDE